MTAPAPEPPGGGTPMDAEIEWLMERLVNAAQRWQAAPDGSEKEESGRQETIRAKAAILARVCELVEEARREARAVDWSKVAPPTGAHWQRAAPARIGGGRSCLTAAVAYPR